MFIWSLLHYPPLIARSVMAWRACIPLLALACAGAAKDCIEVTLTDNVLTTTFFNRTVLKVTRNDSSVLETPRASCNIVKVWERLPKVITPRNGTSEQCRSDSQLYLQGLDRLELWALKMFDATAKPPSGILSGNANQYGDFDECLSVSGAVRGKYCLASLEVTLRGDERADHLDYLVHGGHYIKSNLTDMGHRLPRYSSILWGVCIPSSCSSYDLEHELSDRLSEFGINVKVHNTMCSVQEHKRPFSFGKALSITFFLAILLLLTLGTVFDDGSNSVGTFERLLNAFSIRRNFNKLMDTSETQNRIKGLDAIRGINAICLVFVHKSMAMAHNSYINKTQLAEVFGMPWAVIGRSAIIYTDSFLYLSGFLNAHNLLQELRRKDTIDVKNRVIARWFRLFPLFLSLMLFCTYILPDVNSGPQWNLVVQEHSRVCEKNMWKSFLFIHNYFGFENMCLTHTHQIGLDMQLYVATLPLMLLLWRSRTLGWTLVASAAAASTLLRYIAVYWHDISMFVYYGISVQKLLDAAKYCYILPTHRATIYLMGVAMAFFLSSNKSKFVLTESQTKLLWTACCTLGVFTIVGPWQMGLPGYQFEHTPAAVFAAFSPIVWGIFLASTHWAMSNDHASKGNAFINCRMFKLFNKISYGVYLTQFPIFFYNVGIQRSPGHYSPFTILDLPEMLIIVGISTLTTVAIEMPFNEVHRIFFGKSQTKLKEK